MSKGFLLVTMEPPASLEEEFNDWYDTEHVPERLAVAGFETATRYVCTAGWPRYVAFYDLSSPEVIDSSGYRAISGDRFSPWTKRMLTRVRGFYRVYGEQIYPGPALSLTAGRVLMLRARASSEIPVADWIETARRTFDSRSDFRQLRIFKGAAALGGDLLALVELDVAPAPAAIDVSRFGALSRHIDLCNEYLRYSIG
ncbi:MAG: hypothetical protein ABI885_18090 [Gammaproteobacteria bacterium]